MAAKRPLADFPCSFGPVRTSIYPHAGPASYVQAAPVAGTVPCVGGDRTTAVEAGMKLFHLVDGGITDDGAFTVSAFPLTKSDNQQAASAGTSYGLRWVANVTAAIGGQAQTVNTEAVAGTNLSSEIIRLQAFGPK